METNKPKQLPYQDDFEFWRNLMRILIIVLYTPTIMLMLRAGLDDGREYLNIFGDWPTFHYLIFFFPLGLSLIDLYLFRLEIKSGIPMHKVSRNCIYGSWIVSALFYGINIWAYFNK